jgi:dynein heavy chain
MDENNMFLSTFSLLQSSDSVNSSSKAINLQNIQESIIKKIIPSFNIEEIKLKYPIKYEDCMNSILIQEAMRYNGLLSLMFKSLDETVKAYKGLLPLTDEIEELANNLNNNKTPPYWIKVSYPSRKPLGSWINDLYERIEFFQRWISNDKPDKFWISGFYFTQSFLTGIKQNFARAFNISIDRLEFSFTIIDGNEYDTVAVKERKAYYIYGLFLEGAMWNKENHCLDELQGRRINIEMPPVKNNLILDTNHSK